MESSNERESENVNGSNIEIIDLGKVNLFALLHCFLLLSFSDCYVNSSQKAIKLWTQKIHNRVFNFQKAEDEKTLDCVVEEYSRFLQEDTSAFEDKALLKDTILSHVEFFNVCLSHKPLKPSETTRYLERMEDILTYYCDLELLSADQLRKQIYNSEQDKQMCHQMCQRVSKRMRAVLTTYLLNVQRHVFHVLIKISKDIKSKTTKRIIRSVYS